jgi:hypothetical protein
LEDVQGHDVRDNICIQESGHNRNGGKLDNKECEDNVYCCQIVGYHV